MAKIITAIRLEPTDRERLRELANRRGISRSELIRRALRAVESIPVETLEELRREREEVRQSVSAA